jgi:hypothetical protein
MSPFDPQFWFIDAIRYFRRFGFFESYSDSDAELGETIQSYWRGDWNELLASVSDPPSADQLLLVADTKRVWWHDLEGVYRGANFYPEVLNEWAVISREQFVPEQTRETWQGENGPVEVTFVWNGRGHTFVHRSGDFMDHGILKLINEALTDTSFRYEVATDFADSNWIVMLKQDEKVRLKMERGWHFLW